MQALESPRRAVSGQWEFVCSPDIPEFPLTEGCKLVHYKKDEELIALTNPGFNVVDLKTLRTTIGHGESMRFTTRVCMALVYDPKLIDVATRPIGQHDNPFNEARRLIEGEYRIVVSNPSLVVGWKQKDPIGTS